MKVYIGYDGREHAAYEVCKFTLEKHSSVPLEIVPLKQTPLRRSGLYRRTGENGVDVFDGKPFATEFSFTRFLVPALNLYDGWAMFCDCDFLFRADVKELFDLIDDRYPLMCVHHDYRPGQTTKMDGKRQEVYNMKNWSSLVLWNCSHVAHQNLTVDDVNTKPGGWLHAFSWLGNWVVGTVPEEWNWLVGASPTTKAGVGKEPKALHYTLGGPWFQSCQGVPYADEWIKAFSECNG